MYGIKVPEKKARLLVSSWIPVRMKTLVFVVPIILYMQIIILPPVLAHDDPHDSIERIRLQIEQDPYNAELYLKRGELNRQISHFDAALADFDRVATLSPDNEKVHFHRGRLLFEAGEYPEARLALDRLLISYPSHTRGFMVRGRLLRKLGHPQEAAEDFARALSLTPNPTPVLLLEHAQALAEAGNVVLAIQSLDDWNQKLGPLILLESLAIDLEVEGQRYDAALKRIDRVLTEMSRKEKWLVRRGEVLEMAGRKEEARVAYRDALKTIEALPSRLRKVPALLELEIHVRALLDPERF